MRLEKYSHSYPVHMAGDSLTLPACGSIQSHIRQLIRICLVQRMSNVLKHGRIIFWGYQSSACKQFSMSRPRVRKLKNFEELSNTLEIFQQ